MQPRRHGDFSCPRPAASQAGWQKRVSILEFTVPGRAGLSAATKTAVLNITSTGSQAAGFLTVYPCGTPRPTASNVNYQAGTDIANTVITAIGLGGKVCVYTSSQRISSPT